VSENGAAERFWLELQALYQAASKPTLKQLVRLGLAQDPPSLGCQVFWGTGSELDQALPLQPLLDGLRVREPSPNPRRETIARFLRGELSTDRGMDGPAMLAEQLLALVAQECAVQPTILVIERAHSYLGEPGTGVQVARTALAAAEEAHDSWAMAWALHTMAGAAVSQGRLPDQLSLFDRGLAVTQAEPALTDLRLLLQINKAVALGNLDRYEEGLAIARQAQQLAGQVGTVVRLFQAHSVVGQIMFETGRWDEALAEMAVMPEGLKDAMAVCAELGIAALINFYRGDATAARGFLAAADPHAARIGRLFISPLELARSLDHEQAGALPAALSALTCWLDGSTEEISQVQEILPDAVRLAMRIGDLDTARNLTIQAAAFAAPSETSFVQGNSLYCQGLVGHDAPLLLAAAEQYERASRPLLRAKALEGAATAYARVGATEQARIALTSATEIYGGLGASAAAARMQAAYEAAEPNRDQPAAP
jgi:tetratricopeptide (TPR) repeat protein